MRRKTIFAALGFICLPPLCSAQPAPSTVPDTPTPPAASVVNPPYRPPTQSERFKNYLRQTFGVASILEAGARAGIDQALDRPSQWTEGAQGYGERFGSAMGLITIRGTTEYALSAVFKEDLRFRPCHGCGAGSRFKGSVTDCVAE